ncbi:MAG: hypothetical protein ACI4KL_06165 [Lentihominibacter sp.]
MNRLKDFFYNKNDIIIVLVILVLAGLLIWNRIGAIVDYPAKLAEQSAKTQTTQTVDTTTETTTTQPDGGDSEDKTEASSEQEQ